jgi:hypothetical protein
MKKKTEDWDRKGVCFACDSTHSSIFNSFTFVVVVVVVAVDVAVVVVVDVDVVVTANCAIKLIFTRPARFVTVKIGLYGILRVGFDSWLQNSYKVTII